MGLDFEFLDFGYEKCLDNECQELMDGPSKADRNADDDDSDEEPPDDLYVIFYYIFIIFYNFQNFFQKKKNFDASNLLKNLEKEDKIILDLKEKNERDFDDEFDTMRKKIHSNLRFNL